MPDWFYRTVARRTLFCLPDWAARGVALGTIGGLGRSRAGRALVDFLGHMRADPRLSFEAAGVTFPSHIGIGWRVDPECRATAGLACFGAGCIEIQGRGWRSVHREAGEVLRDGEDSGISATHAAATPGCPVLRRHRGADESEWVELPGGKLLPVVAWDRAPSSLADDGLAAGVMLQTGTRVGGGWKVPAGPSVVLAEQVRRWRLRLPAGAFLIVSGGVADPTDAMALREAGADLILVDAGLVHRGPGLVKRCNEALLRRVGDIPAETGAEATPFRRSWFWASMLGLAMILGGLANLGLAFTRVLLPYDEHYLGLTSDFLERNQPLLFAFMAHDRGTLAGTMLGLGWIYLLLARGGIRRSIHGAKTAVVASALAGFASFFAFFGFGYFDTLHAFVAAVLLQLTIQLMAGRDGGGRAVATPIDTEDGAWRRAQWGQLLWIIHATGLLIAGGIILGIGMTSVLVSEDLAFLCMTPAQVDELGTRLLAVVAHDRATLGGMLLASGTAMLLPTLWTFRRGAAWLWWAIAGLGAPAYAAAIGVHLWGGYIDTRHLVPAFLGMGLWSAGLLLSRGYLCRTDSVGAFGSATPLGAPRPD